MCCWTLFVCQRSIWMKDESDTCLSTEEEKVGLSKLTNAKTNHWLFTDNLYAYENLQDHNTKDVNGSYGN